MRTLLLLSISLAGCVSSGPPFTPAVGVPEFRAWGHAALAQDGGPADHAQFRAAYAGDAAAVSKYFREAHALEMSPAMAAAQEEFLQWTLETLAYRLGDERFAQLLGREPPAVRSAVTHFLQPSRLQGSFLQTQSVLDAAPKMKFPLEEAYRRDRA
jgi:phytoene dehydrogenase-like protein